MTIYLYFRGLVYIKQVLNVLFYFILFFYGRKQFLMLNGINLPQFSARHNFPLYAASFLTVKAPF